VKASLFFAGSCACLLCAAFTFKAQSIQGAFIFGMIALLCAGVLVKVLRN